MKVGRSQRSPAPGCGLYSTMFRRRSFWHRRSNSTSVIPPSVTPNDPLPSSYRSSGSGSSSSRRRGAISDDTSVQAPANLPPVPRPCSDSVSGGSSSMSRTTLGDASLVAPDNSSSAGPQVSRSHSELVSGSSNRRGMSSVQAKLPEGPPVSKAAMKAAGRSRAPLPTSSHKASTSQRRPPESSNGIAAEETTVLRASSGNVKGYGNLGNQRGLVAGKDPAGDMLDFFPKTAKELRMEAEGKKKAAAAAAAAGQQESEAGKTTRASSMESNLKNINANKTRSKETDTNTSINIASTPTLASAPEPAPVLSRALTKRYSPEELKEMGNEEYKNGRFVEALDFYERAIIMDPTKAAYRSNKAAALTALGNLLEAVRECKEAIKVEPSYHKTHHRLATLYLRLGEAEKAIHHFKQARKEASSSDMARAVALQANLVKSSETRKLKDYLTLLKESQSAASSGADAAPQVFALQAEALLKLLRHDEADSILSAAPKYEIDESTKFFGAVLNAYFLMIRAQVDMAAGRFEDAVAMAQKAAQLDPSNREIAVAVRKTRTVASARSRGNDLFKASRFAEACVAYGEGLEHDSYNAILLCNRAACRSKLRHYEKAIEDCSTALIVRPSYSKARLRRANCNAKLARWEASIKDYEVLIQEIPGDEEVSKALAEARAQLKKQRGEHVGDTVD